MKIGESVTLVLNIEALRDFDEVDLTLIVPAGLELISGKKTTILTILKVVLRRLPYFIS